MLTSHEYDRLFTLWKMNHGVQKTSRQGTEYWAVPTISGLRRDMLEVLVDTLVEKHGYTESDFGSLTCSIIIEACVWAEGTDKESLRKWRQAVKSDLLIVLERVFEKEGELVVKNRGPRVTVADYMPTEPEQAPPVVQELDPEAESRRSGIPLPTTVPDLEFLKLLEGPADE